LPTGRTIEDYTVNGDGYVIAAGTEGTVAEVPIKLDQDMDGNADFVKIADMNPDFNLAISNVFRFKNVGLSMLWHWKQGGDILMLPNNGYTGITGMEIWMYSDCPKSKESSILLSDLVQCSRCEQPFC